VERPQTGFRRRPHCLTVFAEVIQHRGDEAAEDHGQAVPVGALGGGADHPRQRDESLGGLRRRDRWRRARRRHFRNVRNRGGSRITRDA